MDIFTAFYNSRDEQKAEPMSAYMKNKFPFLGIQKPERVRISREFLKQKKSEAQVDWQFVFACFSLPEREFHYLAIDYLAVTKDKLKPSDLDNIEQLIITKSWWDSVDSLDAVVGQIGLNYPEIKNTQVLKWIASENIWLKRVAIDFQLKYKEKTDTDILGKAIISNKDTGEFFVNKAIGWALREYSKTNPEWVRTFLTEHELSPLSVREAGKYI